jgi:hypothetical protein
MTSSDADPAARLTELLLPIMRYRIALLGVDGSGAYDFYQTRTGSGRVFGEHEIRLVDTIAAKGLPADEIHEIGCGWGQLVFLLAWRGYRATGFELDSKRFLGADCLRRILVEIDPDHAARATIRNEFFPPLSRPDPRRSLVIATNVVISNPQFVEDQMLWGLRRYRYAIIDIDRFCTLRRPDAYPALLARAEAMGLRSLGSFWDAGPDGHFYLFEPAASSPLESG